MTSFGGIRPHRRLKTTVTAAVAVIAAVTLAACSSSGSTASHPTAGGTSGSSSSSSSGSGPVDVLYAGSLVDFMQQLTPGFEKQTGYRFSGVSNGSSDLAAEIKGKTQLADVFVSASPAADALLQGSANGDWLSWYGTFAKSQLVLGYNPKSSFASQLKTKPWYEVVSEKGFRLGRTDPATDPKGVLAVEALRQTASAKKLPALARLATSQSGVYPEQTLVGRLQAGQLDAGFFYTAEANAAKIATVPLTGTDLAASYTVSVLNRAPHAAAGAAFVKYLLGPSGLALLRQDGFQLVSPVAVTGSGVPSSLSGVLPGS